MLVMVLFTMSTVLAQRTVTGTVVLEGEPAIGANVVIDGNEGVGTVTEFDGTFSLSVPETAKALKISYTGARTQVVSIEGVSSVNVALDLDSEIIEETVVIGYRAKKKEELTGAVATVSAENIENIPVATFDQILQGQAPGLVIASGSGSPGRAAGKVQIRGRGSINSSTDPLYIMDGVPITSGAFATINPNDIQNVSVLKDAAATAIYGSRGANGVIVITTKRGKYDTPTQFSYTTQIGMTTRPNGVYNTMNSAEKLEYDRQAGIAYSNAGISNPALGNPGYVYGVGGETPNQAIIDSLSAINTNWEDIYFRTGISQQHQLSATGGSQKTTFYVSGQYYDEEGISFNSDIKRGTLRFNLQHKANDKFSFGLNMQGGYSRRNFISNEGGTGINPYAAIFWALPYESPYNADGTYADDIYYWIPGISNPLAIFDTYTNSVDEIKAITNLNAEYKIIDGLSFRTNWGIDFVQQIGETFWDPDSEWNNVSGAITGAQGSFAQSYIVQPTWIGTNSLNYTKYINEKHKVSAIVANELVSRKQTNFSFEGYGIDPKRPGTAAGITAGTGDNGLIPVVGGGNSESSLASFFLGADYTFDDVYTVTGTIRYDGSSRLHPNNRWAAFWSVGAAYNIDNEEWFKVAQVDKLQLSLSYGTTGNENLGNYPYRALYGTGSYSGANTLVQTQLENPELSWEKSSTFNLGIEFGMFGNRLDGRIDLYNKLTSDLFVTQSLSLAASGGAGGQLKNSGKMRNRGIEMNLRGDVYSTKDILFSLNANFGLNQNVLLDLGDANESFLGAYSRLEEGKPFGTFYLTEFAGIDPATGVPMYVTPEGNVTYESGDDLRQSNFGTSEVPFSGGLGLEFRYKGFSMSALSNFIVGTRRFNREKFFNENHNYSDGNNNQIMTTTWLNPGDITEVPGYVNPLNNGLIEKEFFSTAYLQDNSFWRLRNVNVAYTIDGKYFKNFISSVKVFAMGQNLLTATKWEGLDPEESAAIGSYEYPNPRTVTMGLEINF